VLFILSSRSIITALFHVFLTVIGRFSAAYHLFVFSLRMACCFFIVLSRYHWALTGACPIVGYKLRPAVPREAALDAVCFE